MKMKRFTAAILLILSLEAIVAGRLSAAVADEVVDTIRLPSHGLTDELLIAARKNLGWWSFGAPFSRCRYSSGGCLKDDVPNGLGVAGHEDEGTAGPRPWRCCDRPALTRSNPPTYQCMDNVDRCSSTCKVCVQSAYDPDSQVCNDEYLGLPGPTCSKDEDDVPSGAHGCSSPSLVAAARLLLAFVVLLLIHGHY